MNKLLIIALFGCLAVALTAAESNEEGNSLQVDDQPVIERSVREADPKKKKKNNEKAGKKKAKKLRQRRKGRKNGKAKKSGKRKARRGKKSRGNKDKKKSNKRKNKNKKKKGRKVAKSGRGNARQTCAITPECFDKAVDYCKLIKNKIKNYINQKTRIENQASLGEKKLSKKDKFTPFGKQVLQLGGGNASALACGSSTSSAGAKKLKSLLDSFEACSGEVEKVCNASSLVQLNKTEVDNCLTTMTSFDAKVTECTAKSGAAACTCFNDPSLETMAKTVRGCNLADLATSQAKKIRTCTSGFASCKTLIDDAGPAMHACTTNPKALLSKIKQLQNNSKKLKAALAKLKTLSSLRRQRQAATCASIIAKAKQLQKILGEDKSSPKVATIADEISSASVTCSADEKASLKTLESALTTLAADLESELELAKATYEASTGSAPSQSDIDSSPDCKETCSAFDADNDSATTSSVMTTKPSRRRRIAVEEILKNQILH